MSAIGIEIEAGGAAAPGQALNSLSVPLTSKATAGLGQGIPASHSTSPTALASFRSSWQSQLASLNVDSDSSSDSVIREEQVRTSSSATSSSTILNQTLSAVADRLGFVHGFSVGSAAASKVDMAGKRTTDSRVSAAHIFKDSKEQWTHAPTGAGLIKPQSKQYRVSGDARTSIARKSTAGDFTTGQTRDAIPVQSSMAVPSLDVGKFDMPNQGQSELAALKHASSERARQSVGDDDLTSDTQSAGSVSSATGSISCPGDVNPGIEAGSPSPALHLPHSLSLTPDHAEAQVAPPEQAGLHDLTAIQASAHGLAERPMSGGDAADRASTQVVIAPQNGATSSVLATVAERNQAGLLACSDFESRASVAAGVKGGMVSERSSAVRSQALESSGATIRRAELPDQAGPPGPDAASTGLFDKNLFSTGSNGSLLPQSMPATFDMHGIPGRQAAIVTAPDQSAALTQFSGPAIQLSPEPRVGELNESGSISEFSGVMKPGTGKSAKHEIQTAKGSVSGELTPATVGPHPAAATAGLPCSDAFSLGRDPNIQTANGVADGVGGAPAAVKNTSTIHQTFATLDDIDNRTALNWVHAGTRHAEAGFEDPTLGWIGVRADQSGGGVHATLVPTTAEGAQALGSQMDGLNAHLTESHTALASLSLGSTESREGGAGSDQGFNQGAGQNQAQSNSHDANVSSTESIGANRNPASAAVSVPQALQSSLNHEAKHISVIA